MFDGRQRRGAGAPVVPGDQHVIRVGLGHSRSHRADAGFGDELDAHPRTRVDRLEVVDQLGQILDRVDVVMRRRRDQLDPRHRVAQPGDEIGHLVRRELAAFARLGALHDLDLQLLGPHQILGGDPEPGGRHLLDAVVGPVPIAQAVIVLRVLAAFAGVGAGAHPVHGDRERRVRLGRQRSEGHRRRDEAPADLFRGLHFLQRHRSAFADGEEIARAGRAAGSVLHQKAAVCILTVRLDRLLQGHHDRRRPPVILAVLPKPHPAVVRQRHGRVFPVRIGGPMPGEDVLGDLLEADAADRRRGPGEAGGDDLMPQPQHLEDLRTAVR